MSLILSSDWFVRSQYITFVFVEFQVLEIDWPHLIVFILVNHCCNVNHWRSYV